MKRLATALCLTGFLIIALRAGAQRISYSQPERDDSRNTEFEIIGKVGSHILVYKNNQGDAAVSIYDNNMNPVNRVPMVLFRKERILSVDFINYPDKFVMVYQYQHRQFIYCYGAVLDENSKLLADPVLIDSTNVGGGTVKDRLYSIVHSEDKSRIMVYKINQNKEMTNIFYTFQLDNQLNLINNSRVSLPMESRRDYLGNFALSNNGDFLFDKVERSTAKDFLAKAWIVIKPATLDTFYLSPLDLKNQYIDELKIKLDNQHQKAYAVSFYYKQKRSDVTGLYFARYNLTDNQIEDQNLLTFSGSLKASAANSSSRKDAFDDYFIRQLIIRSDGGFLVTAESFYSNSQYSPWNRWDYMYGPYAYSPYAYYSPFSPWYYSPFGRNDYGTRFHYDNIAILSYDSTGTLEWSNFVRKEQYDDQTDDFLSYMMVNIGTELHFLYNDPYRRSYILTDNSITPDGKLTVEPTFRNLDKGYEWMPRYGRQIAARQVVIPCIYRNFVCFAKIDF